MLLHRHNLSHLWTKTENSQLCAQGLGVRNLLIRVVTYFPGTTSARDYHASAYSRIQSCAQSAATGFDRSMPHAFAVRNFGMIVPAMHYWRTEHPICRRFWAMQLFLMRKQYTSSLIRTLTMSLALNLASTDRAVAPSALYYAFRTLCLTRVSWDRWYVSAAKLGSSLRRHGA